MTDANFYALIMSASLVLMLAGAVFWVWLLVRDMANVNGKTIVVSGRGIGFFAIQVSIVVGLIGVIRAGGYGVLWIFLPYAPLLEWYNFIDFLDFLGQASLVPLSVGASTFFLLSLFKPTRSWVLAITGIAVVLSSLAAAEVVSRKRMCLTAKDWSVTSIARNNIFWSIRNANREWQWSFHAVIKVEDELWAWSYRWGQWWKVPDTVDGDLPTGTLECS